MLPLILIVLGFLLVLIGSIADLRWREVPDWSNFAGLCAALMIRAVFSLGSGSPWPLVEGLLGLALMWALACALFYLGQWGGGDSKLLMAMGAIFGLSWDSLLGAFLLNLLICGGLWGAAFSARLFFSHTAQVRASIKKTMKSTNVVWSKKACFIAGIILVLAGIVLPYAILKVPLIAIGLTTILTFYTWIFAHAVEKTCFIKDVPPEKLEEGDWILTDIVVKGKRICGPKDLGVSKRQITALINAKVRLVRIKEGVPFVPSFFFAYIATFWLGNLFTLIGRLGLLR